MTKCLNCCGQSFDGMICPNCGHPAYKRGLDEIAEVLNVTVEKRGFEGYASVGPLRYQTQGLMSYAINDEWIARAVCHPTLSVLFCRPEDAPGCDISLVLTDHPKRDFVRFHNWLAETQFYDRFATMIHRGAQVHETAVLAENVSIGEFSIVGPHTAIGMSGARFVAGEYVIHAGGVQIGARCLVGANTTIVRGVWGNNTVIGDRCYIGQSVSIGHNCQVGDDCMILPGAVICGSAVIEDGVTVGPNATVTGHITVGRDAHITLGSVVTRDVPPGETVSGNFAIKHQRLIDRVKIWAKGE